MYLDQQHWLQKTSLMKTKTLCSHLCIDSNIEERTFEPILPDPGSNCSPTKKIRKLTFGLIHIRIGTRIQYGRARNIGIYVGTYVFIIRQAHLPNWIPKQPGQIRKRKPNIIKGCHILFPAGYPVHLQFIALGHGGCWLNVLSLTLSIKTNIPSWQ